jgi:isoleucyl-tRNA synthetase
MISNSPYQALSPSIDLPAIEHEILDFWQTQDIFHQSVKARAGGQSWTFYEGPPTANGLPGTHHIEARVFKDVFPRFHTMKGKQVIRKAGWDCHGLPVEIAVEKELGFSGKGDIEKYGIAAFNEKCRESVQRHVDAFTTMTERMGLCLMSTLKVFGGPWLKSIRKVYWFKITELRLIVHVAVPGFLIMSWHRVMKL